MTCSFHSCTAADAEDENGNREYVEETNKDAVMFALAKLVATDSVPKVAIPAYILFPLKENRTANRSVLKSFMVPLS